MLQRAQPLRQMLAKSGRKAGATGANLRKLRLNPTVPTHPLGASALVAVAAKQNLGDRADRVAAFTTARSQLHFFQAGDAAAIDAEKMGVSFFMAMLGIDRLKPPHMVTQFGATQQTAVREIVEIAEGGGFIEPLARQAIGQLGVRQRRL